MITRETAELAQEALLRRLAELDALPPGLAVPEDVAEREDLREAVAELERTVATIDTLEGTNADDMDTAQKQRAVEDALAVVLPQYRLVSFVEASTATGPAINIVLKWLQVDPSEGHR